MTIFAIFELSFNTATEVDKQSHFLLTVKHIQHIEGTAPISLNISILKFSRFFYS